MAEIIPGDQERVRLESHYRIFVRAIAALVATVGMLVVIGWIFGIDALVRGCPGYTHMRFNAALCLVVSAADVWLMTNAELEPLFKLVRLCGAFVFTLAFFTLTEHVFGWDPHIDQLLMRDAWSKYQPSGMAPLTAVCFCLIGIFLIFFRAQQTVLIGLAQISVVLTNPAAQLAVLDVFFRRDKGDRVAIHTALALFALSLGMLVTPNREGFLAFFTRRTSGGGMIRRLLPTATIGPLAVGWIHWEATRSGLIQMESGIAIMVAVYSATLLAVAIWTAKSSDSIEIDRTRLEQEVGHFFSLPIHLLLAVIGPDGCFKRISPRGQANVKKIVKRHGGRVWAQSELDLLCVLGPGNITNWEKNMNHVGRFWVAINEPPQAQLVPGAAQAAGVR